MKIQTGNLKFENGRVGARPTIRKGNKVASISVHAVWKALNEAIHAGDQRF